MASRLNKLAELYENSENVDELEKAASEEFEGLEVEASCGEKHAQDEEEKDAACKKATEKEAVHPIEHDTSKDDPKANMSSQTGDDVWVDIGPGVFDDKRDEVGRAKETAQ